MPVIKRPKFFLTDFGVYPVDILVTIGTTEAEVLAKLKNGCHYKPDQEEIRNLNFKGKSGYTLRLKGGACILWIKEYRPGLLAHEIFHLVSLLYERIGSKFYVDDDEPVAYLIEFLTNRIYKGMNLNS